MNILMTLSESYVPYCGVTIKSLIDTNKDLRLNIYLLSLNITSDSKKLLASIITNNEKDNIHIYFPEISEEIRDSINSISARLSSNFNVYFILRLFADRILSESIDKILYVDVDTIFTGSIKELDDYTFSPSISMAAVKDLVRPDDYTRLGLTNPNHSYINSGVILLNLKYWREHHTGERCIDQLRKHGPRYTMPDQDAINVVLEGTMDYLHPKYNCLLQFFARREFIKTRVQPDEIERVQEAAKNPAIVHYVFANKPWFKGEYLPYREDWLKTLALTPWKDIPIRYRNGWKGYVQISAKHTIRFILGMIGINYKPSIFYQKRYKHIQIFFLALYYGFAQWLPDSFTPIIGKYSNRLRRWCVKHLFDFTGTAVNIGRRAYFGKGENIWIGSRSNIGAHCHIPSNIIIGDNVMMGPYNYFFENVTHNFQNISIPMIDQGVRAVDGRIEIGDDVWIGRECMVMPGKKIGSHSIIGARSLVTKNVDEYAIVGGNPAKIIRMRK